MAKKQQQPNPTTPPLPPQKAASLEFLDYGDAVTRAATDRAKAIISSSLMPLIQDIRNRRLGTVPLLCRRAPATVDEALTALIDTLAQAQRDEILKQISERIIDSVVQQMQRMKPK